MSDSIDDRKSDYPDTALKLLGKLVVLRMVAEKDLGQLLAWYNDPGIFPYMGRPAPLTARSQDEWFRMLVRDQQDTRVFAIESVTTGSLIGSITLRNLSDPARRGELGVLLGVFGSGYGSDAIRTLLTYAFGELELNCVSLEVRGDNRRAITAYMRAGFRPEGVLRRRMFKGGTLHDVYSMSILREEFNPDQNDD